MVNDRVILKELEVRSKIGCTEEERDFPQKLLVSAELALNTKASAASKDVNDTVCYWKLSQEFKSLAEQKEWILVEELAEVLAATAIKSSPIVEQVELEIRKFIVPHTAWVGVRISRAK